jgi:hypothetical protein
VKTLLQERRIFLPERAAWPVLATPSEIVWMRGFPPAASHLAGGTAQAAVVIEEVPLISAQKNRDRTNP